MEKAKKSKVNTKAKETKETKPEIAPKVKPIQAPKFDPIDAAMQKYREFGWTTMRAPKESINDLIAQKIDSSHKMKLHFVQIVTTTTIEDLAHTGVARNTFIQNAFSNGAVPVFAHVVTAMRKSPEGPVLVATVTFEDVNLNARIIIGGNKKPVDPGCDEKK